jgi:glycosyltransferase involved in cell wall biosynthesis
MPVWNGEQYLAPAIESILGQSFGDFEFIIVDDGSTDNTPAILRSYSDTRMRVYRLDHAGIVAALNHGIAQAHSAWIARQDGDDISLPDRLKTQWEALRRRPGAVLAHTAVALIGSASEGAAQARLARSRSFTAVRLCQFNPIVHSTVLFRKEVALAVGGYRQEERHAEDYALWGRLLPKGEFVGLPDKLVQYRIHPQSVSKQNLEAQKALAERIAIQHCKDFLRLDDKDAVRAHALLSIPAHKRVWRDWWWFVGRCKAQLPWRSLETDAWLLQQSLKQLLRI